LAQRHSPYAELKIFNVPESVEIIGAQWFDSCFDLETVEFDGLSKLKKIGERTFSRCRLHSITIPAFAE
jgi:hypothetical protein